jgi:glycosyltransferase involved in cell wall biosynthesis
MSDRQHRSLIMVPCWPGQAGCAELERQAARGEAPRIDYVMLSRCLDADVIDYEYMTTRAPWLAQSGARRVNMVLGQVTAAFLRQQDYRHIFAWGERLGLPLALAFKLARSRRDLVFLAAYSSTAKRAAVLKYMRVHSHVRAICYDSGTQLNRAATRLGIPPGKLHLALPGVDERFWYPVAGPIQQVISSVGSEARDYATLIAACQGLDVTLELVVGGIAATSKSGDIGDQDRGPRVKRHARLSWHDLRQLYSRSRFVVVPTHDVEYNAGITAIKEAMAMGRAVIATRSRGQTDYMRDGEQGIFVAPGDPAALRSSIEYLLDHPDEAARMGRAGRALVEQHHTLDSYVARLARIVRTDNEA